MDEVAFGNDVRNCSFFIDIAEPINKTLLDQINERYSDLVDLNGSFSYSLSYKSNRFVRDKIEVSGKIKSDLNFSTDGPSINTENKNSPRKSGLRIFIITIIFSF